MKSPMQLLAEQAGIDGAFRQIVAGEKPVLPWPQKVETLEAGIEGAIKMLDGMTAPNAIAAVTILKGAMQK